MPHRAHLSRTTRGHQPASPHALWRGRLSGVGPAACHRGMVDTALMERVDRLSPSEPVELRDAIQAELGDEWKAIRRARRTV